MNYGVVTIGRNEGERLKRCLESVPPDVPVVYVDSGSTDGSAQRARNFGKEVVELDSDRPFTAARARNAGLRRLKQAYARLQYVQFVDGDCELEAGWLDRAAAFLDEQANVAAACGRRRERFPEKSIYNWLCDRDWDRPPGEAKACGGDAMMRIEALELVGGFRDDLIAGEEPELCLRLRAAGWRVSRLQYPMTLHDAAMTRFTQWWVRVQRSGYAFAQGAYLHGASPERYRMWETRRAWLWGFWLPIGCIIAGLIFSPWGWTAWLIYPLQVVRQSLRSEGPFGARALQGLFQVLARFPEAWGQIQFMRDHLFGRQSRLIEYK